MDLTCAPRIDITITGIAEAIQLGRKPIRVDFFDDLVLQRAIAAIGQVGGVLAGQLRRVVPAEDRSSPIQVNQDKLLLVPPKLDFE
jgi:hypothetical protein